MAEITKRNVFQKGIFFYAEIIICLNLKHHQFVEADLEKVCLLKPLKKSGEEEYFGIWGCWAASRGVIYIIIFLPISRVLDRRPEQFLESDS